MSLQGGFMFFQETGPSAMKFLDHTVAPVSASSRRASQAWLQREVLEDAGITAFSFNADMQLFNRLLGSSQLSPVCSGAVGGSRASVACTAWRTH